MRPPHSRRPTPHADALPGIPAGGAPGASAGLSPSAPPGLSLGDLPGASAGLSPGVPVDDSPGASAGTPPGGLTRSKPRPARLGLHQHPPPPNTSSKTRPPDAATATQLAQLDGLRGLAALIVVLWHFAFAFLPARIGIVPPFNPADGIVGSPVFALIDGPGAVMLFFVLSGYVLPLAYFRSGQTEIVLRAVAKRWFRLAGLTVAAAVASYLLFRFGLYHYREAASLTGSDWLGSFGGGDVGGRLQPSFRAAILEGAVFAFLRDTSVYDPVLWTMRDELFGSLMTFAVGMLLWRCRTRTGILVLLLAAAATQCANPRLIAFVAGLALSWATARDKLSIPRWTAPVCLLLGAFLFGYLEPRGLYAPFRGLLDASPWRYDRIWLHTIGGVL